MRQPLVQRPVNGTEDLKKFFNDAANEYTEQHGPALKLLNYRLGLIRSAAEFQPADRVLEIGCGPGNHLLPLESYFFSGIGTDLSDEMIRKAKAIQAAQFSGSRINFRTDDAETLSTIDNESVDVVFCVGAFEHMINKKAVFNTVRRVLSPGGRFICLTPNGDYLWYKSIAPRLGLQTTRLSTDKFLGVSALSDLCESSGFCKFSHSYWTFVPGGDMPAKWARLLHLLDGIGKGLNASSFRGGLVFRCVKPIL